MPKRKTKDDVYRGRVVKRGRIGVGTGPKVVRQRECVRCGMLTRYHPGVEVRACEWCGRDFGDSSQGPPST